MIDVAIIGGGPAGSTCGSLLKKYMPELSVLILERERFPREHVGESLLPGVMYVLDEMGCWDKVEAAGFPIKIGATYRWGNTFDLWDFEFYPGVSFKDEDRPGKFEGQREKTAFQVDRQYYDKVLLDHAASLGCEVREETRVLKVNKDGDRVTGLTLENGEEIQARYYVDATGVSGLIRRAMGVEADYPTALRNIAFWDYWQNAEWAVNIGVDGTRILVLSLQYGWMWFIPISATRTSIGLVLPMSYYKESDMSVDELYRKALSDEPLIKDLITNATCENTLRTTNDWSYISDRLAGENWFLAGDSCGFADPILSAGLSLAQAGARQVAYSILELIRGQADSEWIKESYNTSQRARIRQHVRFADLWYGANGCFSDLREYTREIAEAAGFTLDADDAFRWLAFGGFAYDDPASPIVGGFALAGIKILSKRMSLTDVGWNVSRYNLFRLNLDGAEKSTLPVLFEGRIYSKPCYRRGSKLLPEYGFYGILLELLRKEDLIQAMVERLKVQFRDDKRLGGTEWMRYAISALEAMIGEGWVVCDVDPNYPLMDFELPDETSTVHANRDIIRATLVDKTEDIQLVVEGV